tara:strand:+ start:1052 stop:1177 length:126 start_codon:yes stop_codon:yes gene_type:complete
MIIMLEPQSYTGKNNQARSQVYLKLVTLLNAIFRKLILGKT